MLNFSFHNPVAIHFGDDSFTKLAIEIPQKARVLITYGKGSIKNNGIYAKIVEILNSSGAHQIIEFGGIEPNPQYDTLMRGVKLARENAVDFILAVGGGSVIDGTKFIAAAIPFTGEPWDILTKNAKINAAIPFSCVLTIPAAGSEMNCGAVISRASTKDKLVFAHPLLFPKFAILNPTVTYTLPQRQTCNGIIDTFVHITELYLTYPVNAALQDRFAEGVLLTLVEEAPKVLTDPKNYATRANLMWCATMAINGLLSAGVPEDWATHRIGHELTALFGFDHAQSLAIILPSLLNVCQETKKAKLLQYAERIWNITSGTEQEKIATAIKKTVDFFKTLETKTSLKEYGIGEDAVPKILEQLKRHGMTALGEKQNITLEISEQILKQCVDGVEI